MTRLTGQENSFSVADLSQKIRFVFFLISPSSETDHMTSSSREMLSELNEAHPGEIGDFGLELFDEYMKKQSALQKAELNHGSTKLL